MNYWWRLYAHLAPILPGTVLLSRVEQLARAAAPPPKQRKKPFFKFREIRAIWNQMLCEEDDEKLEALGKKLRYRLQQYGEDHGRSEKSSFGRLVDHTGYPKNYEHALRKYNGAVRRRRAVHSSPEQDND